MKGRQPLLSDTHEIIWCGIEDSLHRFKRCFISWDLIIACFIRLTRDLIPGQMTLSLRGHLFDTGLINHMVDSYQQCTPHDLVRHTRMKSVENH
jgi:hypothetical protein